MSNNPPTYPPVDLRTAAVEIAPDTYWVGKREPGNVFYSNPYLRRFRGTDPRRNVGTQFNLLVDPGSSSDFATVHAKVSSVIGGLEKLSALFINHQDPDVGSSAGILTARYAPRASILCSEDTWRLIVHLNLPRDRFLATEKYAGGIGVPTGHKVLPVPTPFCHFRGAVALYDPETRVLFSGDLFGGLTEANAKGLWAEESDWAGIRAFHQEYMPVNAALARAVAAIRKLSPAVEVIAPQHGRLIRGPLVARFLDKMERLQVGLDIIDEAKDQSSLQGWNAVLGRVLGVARARLGGAVTAKLLASPELADSLRIQGDQVTILSLGKWTVERAVEKLCEGERAEVAGPILVEASAAAAEYDLPTPHMAIESAEPGSDPSLVAHD